MSQQTLTRRGITYRRVPFDAIAPGMQLVYFGKVNSPEPLGTVTAVEIVTPDRHLAKPQKRITLDTGQQATLRQWRKFHLWEIIASAGPPGTAPPVPIDQQQQSRADDPQRGGSTCAETPRASPGPEGMHHA